MSPKADIEFVGQLIDAFEASETLCCIGVAPVTPDGSGVPPEMQVGDVDEEGWVAWKVLPSTLNASEVEELEKEFGVQFPPLFRAYLLARFHLFDQVHSRKYNQLIFMSDTPSRKSLAEIRALIEGWQDLIDAGFVAFAEWGDSWGPMCFDVEQRAADGDCPIVWMDHELLIPLGEQNLRKRELVMPLVHPLYASCREFLLDVFTPS